MMRVTVAVHGTARDFRLACDRALRAAGASVRLSSRGAELAKNLTDGTVALVIQGAEASDAVTVAQVVNGAVLGGCATPGETTDHVVHRALDLLASSAERAGSQDTSSA
jgi:hypothetical protein